MTYFKTLPDDAGPGQVFAKYHDIYGHWAKMGQEIMNGPSVFTPGEREMIAAYTVGCAGTEYGRAPARSEIAPARSEKESASKGL